MVDPNETWQEFECAGARKRKDLRCMYLVEPGDKEDGGAINKIWEQIRVIKLMSLLPSQDR